MLKSRHNFRHLEIWKRALKLSVEIYKVTQEFPTEEKFALTSQMRRAAVSVHSNIAEGSGRSSNLDFSKFLHYAIGSLYEIESQIIYAKEIDYINKSLYLNMQKEIIEIQKMISSFERKLTA